MTDYFYSIEECIWRGMLQVQGRIWTTTKLLKVIEDLSNEENQ